MASLNQLQIIGNVGKAPDLRYLASGDPVCAVSVATNEKHKDRNGNPIETTEWHRVVLFGRQAEIAAQYLVAGSQVFIQGRLRTRDYQDRDGQSRRIVEVLSDKLVLLGSAKASQPRVGGDSGRLDKYHQPAAPSHPSPASVRGAGGEGAFDDLSDDIPF